MEYVNLKPVNYSSLCVSFQMIKDMVAVSEATNWSTRSSTEAKYKALRCRVEGLDTTEAEYKQIKEHMLQSLKQYVNILIYEFGIFNKK